MCIFNFPIDKVSGTRILVYLGKDGRQYSFYENAVVSSGGSTNAMILPAPFDHTKQGNEIGLIDLSNEKFSEFFKSLNDCFPTKVNSSRGMHFDDDDGDSLLSSKLEVHAVGSYNVSIARNLGDLRRIDESVFKVAPNVDEILSAHYPSGFGFIICCFDPSRGIEGHPIGYVHEPMGSSLFVPTLHEHGDTGDLAPFDHQLFSLNTKENCGKTPEETSTEFTKEGHSQDPPRLKPFHVLHKLGENLPPIGNLRRLELTGLMKNQDYYFALLNETELQEAVISSGNNEKQAEMLELEKRREEGRTYNAQVQVQANQQKSNEESCILL